MLSFPFNSSTAIFYWNKDAFKKAGLDPNKPPKTWKEVVAAAEKLKASGHACAYTTSWPSWVHVENFSAWHNVPIGTKENGLAGLDTQFQINTPLHVRHLTMLQDLATLTGLVKQHNEKLAEAGLDDAFARDGLALKEHADGRDLLGILGLRSESEGRTLRNQLLAYATMLAREVRAKGANACYDDPKARARFESASFRNAVKRVKPK